MAKRFQVTVVDGWRYPTFRSAGREFSKAAPVVVHEGEPGSEEILACPFLEAEQIDAPEPKAEQPELSDAEDGIEIEQVELSEMEDEADE